MAQCPVRLAGMEQPILPIDDLLPDDESEEIRYSLTALGEAAVDERRGRFLGFGPCVAVA